MKPLLKLLSAIPLFTILSCTSHYDGIQYPDGGYNFPKGGNKNGAGCFPPAGQISRRDSFYVANDEPYFLNLFDEPDLSVKPSPTPLFRLAYKDRFNTYIILLTKEWIIVKKGEGRYWKEYDYSKLTKQELEYWNILRKYYPIDENLETEKQPIVPPPPPATIEDEILRYARRDSIKRNTPLLLKTDYYDYLEKKATSRVKDTFSYSQKQIKITEQQFMAFVGLLNQSIYWTMPYFSECCTDSDGYRYTLECNTGRKYNHVGSDGPCTGDTTAFHQACQLLVEMAKVNDLVFLAYKPKR